MTSIPVVVENRPLALRGEKVGLASLRREDVALFHRWFQDLEMTVYLGRSGFVATLEDENAWYESQARRSDEQVQFTIVELSSQRPVGNVGLFNIRPTGTATLGIAIGEPEARGKGYGSEAVRLMVEYGMFFRNLHNVMLEFVSFNERGRRAYERAGFREVGRLRGFHLMGGERYDKVIMDITREEVDLGRMRALVPMLPEVR